MAPEIVKSTAGNGPAPAIAAPTHAYVTFLAGDGDYYKGVVGLAKGLRKVGAAFPLVVAVLPDVPEEHRRVLVEQGCLVREIEPVFPPAAAGGGTPYVRAYFVVNYCKLRLWEVKKAYFVITFFFFILAYIYICIYYVIGACRFTETQLQLMCCC